MGHYKIFTAFFDNDVIKYAILSKLDTFIDTRALKMF